MEKFNYITSEVDTQVSALPVFLSNVIVFPHDGKQADVTLHDGSSASDPKLITFRTLTGQTTNWNFEPAIKTKRGLYLDVGGDVDGVLIQYTTDVK